MDRDRQRNRRRARAQKLKEVGVKDVDNGNETGDDILEPRPARPPNRKRKLKEPLFEEDIIDGFAIYSFKAYSDIERAVKLAEKKGFKTLDPLLSTQENSVSAKKRKHHDDHTQDPGASSGDGYFCDHSASDDGKISDAGSEIFHSVSKREPPGPVAATAASVMTNGSAGPSPITIKDEPAGEGPPTPAQPHTSRQDTGTGAGGSELVSRGFLPHPGLMDQPGLHAGPAGRPEQPPALATAASQPSQTPATGGHSSRHPAAGGPPRHQQAARSQPDPAAAGSGRPGRDMRPASAEASRAGEGSAQQSMAAHRDGSSRPAGRPSASRPPSSLGHPALSMYPGLTSHPALVSHPSLMSHPGLTSHPGLVGYPGLTGHPGLAGHMGLSAHIPISSHSGSYLHPNDSHPLSGRHPSSSSAVPSHSSSYSAMAKHPSLQTSKYPGTTVSQYLTSASSLSGSRPGLSYSSPVSSAAGFPSPYPDLLGSHPGPVFGLPGFSGGHPALAGLPGAHMAPTSRLSPYPSATSSSSPLSALSGLAGHHPGPYPGRTSEPAAHPGRQSAQSGRPSPHPSPRPGSRPSPHPSPRPGQQPGPRPPPANHTSPRPPSAGHPSHLGQPIRLPHPSTVDYSAHPAYKGHPGHHPAHPPPPDHLRYPGHPIHSSGGGQVSQPSQTPAEGARPTVSSGHPAPPPPPAAPPRLKFGISDLVATPSPPATSLANGGGSPAPPPAGSRRQAVSYSPASLSARHSPAARLSQSPASVSSRASPLPDRLQSLSSAAPSARPGPHSGLGVSPLPAAHGRGPPPAAAAAAAPPPPVGLAPESAPPANSAELLRRELNSRFLASQERSGLAVGPPELHQHQHHQPGTSSASDMRVTAPVPPLVKATPKMGGAHSPLFRNGLPPGLTPLTPRSAAPGLTPSLTPGLPPSLTPGLAPSLTPSLTPGLTPGLAPGLLPPGLNPSLAPGLAHGLTAGLNPGLTPGLASGLTPASVAASVSAGSLLPGVGLQPAGPKKTGRWNAMHVRIAWEIYKNKRKAASGSGGGLDPARGASAGPPLLMASAPQPSRAAGAGPLDVLGAHQLHSQPASSRHLALARPSLQPPPRGAPVGSSATAPLQASLPEFSAYRGLAGPGPSPLRSVADPGLSALDPWARFGRPPAPVISVGSLKPELGPPAFGGGSSSAYSPSAERDRERRAPAEPSQSPAGRRETDERDRPAGLELKAPGRHQLNGHAPRPDPLSQLYGAAAAAAAPRPLLPYGLDPAAGPRLDPYAALSAGSDPLRSLERDRQLMQLNGLAPLLYREPPAAELARHQQLERLALERDRQLLDHKLQLAGMYGAPMAGLIF
ncbi:collagen alpha-1(III) chain-like [Amphibalanus amphitrite]|uniref:collagen alpha-1(III) chain-like n=1 Tax=Amphibalanus amphitrite TaxID=1232801 RepID=UPI001C91F73A|nr:collagen alpha-1(III) chain-like [Amphibalanus amphitrite]